MADLLRIGFPAAFRNSQVVIVVGRANSEKTTQVPQWCLETLRGSLSSSSGPWNPEGPQVVCTQPKKEAAVSAATRVATGNSRKLGEEVGFAIRFENRSGPKTALKYSTDSTLLREAGAEPLFKGYGCIVLDEVQERTVATEILMVLLKTTLSIRADLKLVVMTDAADAERFRRYFDNAPIVTFPGVSNPLGAPEEPKMERRRRIPEILRCDLMPVVLQLKKLSASDPFNISYIDPPALNAVNETWEALRFLGALDDSGKLTEIGEIMARFPLEPQLARALIAACELHCSNEVRSIIAMLSIPGFDLVPRSTAGKAVNAELMHADGDHLTILNIYRALKRSEDISALDSVTRSHELLSRAEKINSHLESIMNLCELGRNSTEPSTGDNSVNIRRAFVAGCFMQLAFREKDAKYRTLKDNEIVELHPASSIGGQPEWVFYNELVESPGNCIRTVTAMEPEWLLDLIPRSFLESSNVSGEAKTRLEEIAARLRD